MPNPQEVATLLVAGRKFEDFESVFVQFRWTEPYPIFRFTTADIAEVPGTPPPSNWQKLQFKPGDECSINLGGIPALSGVITVRQTAYDKDNKGVMLQGIGITWYAARASVIHPTGNFDNKSFVQIAREVIAPTGVGVKVIGQCNPTPFERLQLEPGETVWNFLERIARPRGIVMGSDASNFLLIGDHVGDITGDLVEGINILRCQCVIQVADIYSDYILRGQTAANDQQHGTKASEQEAHHPGTAKRYSPLLTTAEQPVWSVAELADRAKNESIWHEGTIVQATIVVQGWLRGSTNYLWTAGDDVRVNSPMAMLTQVMKIQTVTFTQDRNAGTTTTLDLVAPWLLKDKSDFNLNNATAPQAPDPNAQPAQPFNAAGVQGQPGSPSGPAPKRS